MPTLLWKSTRMPYSRWMQTPPPHPALPPAPPPGPSGRPPHEVGRGRQLRYRDPRRFGRLLLGTEESLLASKKLPRLGPEPIDPAFAADELYRTFRKRRTNLKALLLDQGAIAGVGNIYADE